MTLASALPKRPVVCSAEFDGSGWLFSPIGLLVGPRRLDLAGGIILLGQVAVELQAGRVATCRTPIFRQYSVTSEGEVLLEPGSRFRILRSAVRMDREAASRGAIGINRALARRTLAEQDSWEPEPVARRAFLTRAIELAARPHQRAASEDWFFA